MEWTNSSKFEAGESGDDVGSALIDQQSILRQLSENKGLVVDSSGYRPQTHRKAIANSALDKMEYSPRNASEFGPGQYPPLGLKQPLKGQFSKQIEDNPSGIPFQKVSLGPYRKRETSNLTLGQGEYFGRKIVSPFVTTKIVGLNMQTKNVVVGSSRINNEHANKPPTWTSALGLSKTSFPNNDEEIKAPCLQSMTRENIQRTQRSVAKEAYVRSDIGGGQQTYMDTHLQVLARGNMQNNVEQTRFHSFLPNVMLNNVDNEHMAGLGYGSLNVMQQKDSVFKDSGLFQEPSHLQNNQQVKFETQNDGTNQFFEKTTTNQKTVITHLCL